MPASGADPTALGTDRPSVHTPAVPWAIAGAGIKATVGKAAAALDAGSDVRTGFSARPLIGLLGTDDFGLKLSREGSACVDAIRIDRSRGREALPPHAAVHRITNRSPLVSPWIATEGLPEQERGMPRRPDPDHADVADGTSGSEHGAPSGRRTLWPRGRRDGRHGRLRPLRRPPRRPSRRRRPPS